MKSLITLLLCFTILQTNGQPYDKISLSGDLEFGPHKVGLKQITLPKTSKDQKETSLTVWHPAQGNGEKMVFADYLNYQMELSRSDLINDISRGISGKENSFAEDTLNAVLSARMYASQNSLEKEGPFPLLLWSARYGTVEYQCVLSEYLASHGYVVAYPEDNPNGPYPWAIPSSDEKASALQEQIERINAAIEHLKGQGNVDGAKIGMLAWSYAGESAVLTQISNPEIDLVIGFSAIGFYSGVYLGNKLAERIDVANLKVPYLLLFESVAPNGNKRTIPAAFNSLHPNSRYLSFEKLGHGSFNGIEGMLPGVLRTTKVQSWSVGGEVAQQGHEAICQSTLAFLNAVFHQPDFSSFDAEIQEIQEELPPEFLLSTAPEKE